MPIESITSSSVINALNNSWPTGADDRSGGDDHLRLIKSILLQTFPNITGVVTKSHTDINNGSVPAGSTALFYQAAAPAGWFRASRSDTRGIRVVASTDDGGTYGGSDDPILMDKVPTHQHYYYGTTDPTTIVHSHDAQSASAGTHTHGASTATAGSHTHSYKKPETSEKFNTSTPPIQPAWADSVSSSTTESAGDHTHSVTINNSGTHTHGITIGSNSAAHTHQYSGTTNGNISAHNWTPRYLDMILCTKS